MLMGVFCKNLHFIICVYFGITDFKMFAHDFNYNIL
jgi:hypothetical protein